MNVDPDQACPHQDFSASVEVNRLSKDEGGPIDAYSADIRVWCTDCNEPFQVDRRSRRAAAQSPLLQRRRGRDARTAAPRFIRSGFRARHPGLRDQDALIRQPPCAAGPGFVFRVFAQCSPAARSQ